MTKCRDHLGQEFSSIRAMCKHWGVLQSTYYGRKKAGRTLEEALTGQFIGTTSTTNSVEQSTKVCSKKIKSAHRNRFTELFRQYDSAWKKYKLLYKEHALHSSCRQEMLEARNEFERVKSIAEAEAVKIGLNFKANEIFQFFGFYN